MILVLLGTQNNSFHRLIEEIEKLIQKGKIKEKVIVQAGYTKVNCKEMETLQLVSKQELEKLQNKANIIITHGRSRINYAMYNKRKKSNSSSKACKI